MSSITLIQVIEEYLRQKNVDLINLDCSNRKINKIGIIPLQIGSKIITLNLQNNLLKSLQGIQRFSSLQCLKLSNNRINDGSQILRFKNLKKLKKIYLSNNSFLNKPLQDQVLTYLGGLSNDLQILEFAFNDQKRQQLVYQNKLKKSRSKSPYNSKQSLYYETQLKNSRKKSPLNSSIIKELQSINRSQSVKSILYKSNKKSKVDQFLKDPKNFIQQKHESQQISNSSMQKIEEQNKLKQQIISNRNLQESLSNRTPQKFTQKFDFSKIKAQSKSPKSLFTKQDMRSTKFKTTNIKSQLKSNQFTIQQGSTSDKNGKSFFPSQSQSINKMNSFSSKQVEYQVNNLKINLQSDVPDLNYPSIIQKQDNDSYEIEFDFMSSPKKLQRQNKKSINIQNNSPYRALKDLDLNQNIIQQNSFGSKFKQVYKSPKNYVTKKISQITQEIKQKRKKQEAQEYHTKPSFCKGSRNLNQNTAKFQPLQGGQNLAKKGSLYESVRSFLPQNNISNTFELINKVFSLTIGDLHLNSFSYQSPVQIIQNLQKFQRFYYSSLARIKPAFNLLYSPFHSLNVEQKNILLQELFKNHKQIFMLLLKQFHGRQIAQNSLQTMKNQYQNLQFQIENKNKAIQNGYLVQKTQKLTIQQLQDQNHELRQKLSIFQKAYQSRQKLIADVQKQYQKIKKQYYKKQILLKKYIDADQIQQKIRDKRQIRRKAQYLKKIIEKGYKITQIKTFEQIRLARQKRRQQNQNYNSKKIIFDTLKRNYQNKLKVIKFTQKINKKILKRYVNAYKNQVKISKLQTNLQKNIKYQKKRQFFNKLKKKCLKNNHQKKLNQIYKNKILKKIFIKGFKQNYLISKNQNQNSIRKAIQFQKIKTLSKYLNSMRCSISNVDVYNEKKIKLLINKVIVKRQLKVFLKISKLQIKQLQNKQHKVKNILLKYMKSLNFIQQIKKNFLLNKNKKIKANTLKKYLIQIKLKNMKKNVKIQGRQKNKFRNILRNIAHKQRIEELVQQFKYNLCLKQLNKLKMKQFLSQFMMKKIQKQQLNLKKAQLIKHLTFRRSFTSKYRFISSLRQLNIKLKSSDKMKQLQLYFLNQQAKYKQSFELNIQTIQTFKQEINNYLNQIQFSKLQIQKLSQRQLLILEEKQDCLLEIQDKQQQNQQLRANILEYEKIIDQLQKKYQKALDMYSIVVKELNKKQIKLEANQIYYQSLNKKGIISPSNLMINNSSETSNYFSIKKQLQKRSNK